MGLVRALLPAALRHQRPGDKAMLVTKRDAALVMVERLPGTRPLPP